MCTGQGNPDTMDDFVALVERQIAAELYRCFRCQEFGYIAVHCPNEPEAMQCNVGYNEYLCGVVNIVNVAIGNQPFLIEVKINGKDTQALADFRQCSNVGFPSFCETKRVGAWTGITCMHGDIHFYPTTKMKMELRGEMQVSRVRVVPKLLHAMILGSDYTGFHTLVKIQGELANPIEKLSLREVDSKAWGIYSHSSIMFICVLSKTKEDM